MDKKKSFILYLDTIEQFEMLTDEQAGVLIKALLRYCDTGERLKTEDGMLVMAFSFLSSQIDRDSEKWDNIRQKRRDAINKRWKKESKDSELEDTNEYKSIQKIQKNTNDTVNVNVNDSVNDNVNDNVNVSVNGSVINNAPSPSSPNLENLIYDYGRENVDKYVQRVRSWYKDKGKSPSDLEGTVRKWLEQDGIEKIDHSIDKYNCIINKF